MSLMNLHYRKIVKEYFKIHNYVDFEVLFIESNENWFFKKNKGKLTFNTKVIEQIKKVPQRSAVNFIDCLITCCLYELRALDKEILHISLKNALTVINSPFKNRPVRNFLKLTLGYTAKQNYENLVIADELESIL